MKKYHGEWHKEKKVLFPGYVFLVSGDKDRLFLELKKVTGLTKLLGTGQEVVPLTLPEIEFLQRFGKEDQIVEMQQRLDAPTCPSTHRRRRVRQRHAHGLPARARPRALRKPRGAWKSPNCSKAKSATSSLAFRKGSLHPRAPPPDRRSGHAAGNRGALQRHPRTGTPA